MAMIEKQGFNASFLQIRIAYLHLTGERLTGHYGEAANRLIDAYGRQRVERVILAVPNDPSLTDEQLLSTITDY